MRRLLDVIAIAVACSSCGAKPDGDSNWYGGGGSGGGGGSCVTEEPLWRAQPAYVVSAAPAGLEHLVGATLAYDQGDGGDGTAMVLGYTQDGIAYTVVYAVTNAE